jgi:murein L,D-transpeptidase YafK
VSKSLFFPLLLSAALVACSTGVDRASSTRHLTPLSEKTQAELQAKGMSKNSSILVRLFKQESELEVWKQTSTGRYALFRTYPICKWSGDLGPKVQEGDRQAPEGFYNVTAAQMNPKSQYYLAFNIGFPNKFDSAHRRNGTHLMVHGDCTSRGCYAMTDEAIGEIYALARDAFDGGQKAFQLQAYPFRMTARNFAQHRNNPHFDFWKMLKEGSDHFEVSHVEPKVDFCEKKYVFNAEVSSSGLPAGLGQTLAPTNATLDPWSGVKTKPQASRARAENISEPVPALQERTNFTTSFNASEACPKYSVVAEFAQAVAEKHALDSKEFVALSQKIEAAPPKSGVDGGMHHSFARKFGVMTVDPTVTGSLPRILPPLPAVTTEPKKPGLLARLSQNSGQ